MKLANGMKLDFAGYSALQHESEISEMLNTILAEDEIKNAIEIGNFEGATTYLWAQLVVPHGGKVYCIDVQFGPGNKATLGWENRLQPIYRQKGVFGEAVVEIEGISQSREIKDDLAGLLGGREVDFLFIDGDHDYEPAKADFEDYSPFVRDRGWIAFHDIRNEAWGVSELWKELKKQYESWEFYIHEQPEEIRKTCREMSFINGIGLIRWRSK